MGGSDSSQSTVLITKCYLLSKIHRKQDGGARDMQREKRNLCGDFVGGNMKKRVLLKDPVVEGRIILKWI